MSLNGLEAPEVYQAYQAALGEGGGWFLLKYISRDEVGLLERGSGGLSEVQEAVNRYEEQSPLFGFIQYRRRKVILKYVPEGTSRLLQARVSVQFQSITEKLSPHDTIYPFAQASELQETTLSSACSLHTAASIKSKDSSPHRGLAGITEDASESRTEHDQDGRIAEGLDSGDVSVPKTSEDLQTRIEKVNGRASAEYGNSRSPSIATQSTYRPRTTSDTNKALPPPPEDYTLEDNSGSLYNYIDYNKRPSVDERYSSQSARPSTRDLRDTYEYKPKVKLGPRPSMDSQRTPEHRSNDFRPVASLPAGLRMPSRKAVSGRPVSQQAQSSSPEIERHSPKEMPPPPPRTPITPIQIPDRKLSTYSNGLPTPLKSPESNAPKMTPEKRRLMKALQLRQKQLAAQKPVNGLGIGTASEEQAPEVIRPEVDGAVLDATVKAHSTEARPDPVHIAVRDLGKEEPHNFDASPISIAETSDGPSTQASSITDEEDLSTKKTQDQNVELKSTLPEVQDLSPQADADVTHHSSGTETIRVLDKYHEPSTAHEKDSKRELENVTRHSDPTLPISTGHIEQRSSEMETLPPGPNPFLQPTDSPSPVKIENDVAHLDEEKVVMAQCNLVTSSDRSPEDVIHDRAPGYNPEESAISHGTPAPSQGPTPQQQVPFTRTVALDDNQNQPTAQIPQSESLVTLNAPIDEAPSYELPLPIVNKDEEVSLEPSQASLSTATLAKASQPPIDEEKPLTAQPLPSAEFVAKMPTPPVSAEVDESVEQAKNNAPTAVASQAPLKVETESLLLSVEARRRSQASDITATKLPPSNIVHEPQTERSVRRQRVIEPVERMSSAEQSDEHFLSDDSFMEELNSATVQEAKPVSVSKSPIKPLFPRSDSQQRLVDTKSSRSVSSPINALRNNGEVSPSRRPPTSASIRSFSASHAPRPDEQTPPMPMPKKIGVSSGISQRIKALEQSRQTNRPASPQSQASTPSPATFMNLRKNAQRSPPEATRLNRNQSTHTRPSTAYPSPSPSPDYVKWNPFSQSKKIGTPRPESVSVTATIIRDATNRTPELPVNPSEPRTMDLHRSPLVIEHQEMKPPPPPLSPLKPPRPRYARYSSARSGSSSSNDQTQKTDKPPNSRRDSFASIRSKSSRAGSEAELPRSISDSSFGSPGSPGSPGNPEDKKDSKRSRLLKRMSSISSMSRRSIAHALSPGPKEGPILESQEPIAEPPQVSSAVELGDVNIQFPDTLLWKRRRMTIDEKGILVLEASKSDNNSKVVTKRYALSQFRPPYIPDQDRQELPNSVILDFIDGSTLQCACEHPQGQAGVLQALRQAHATWSQ